MSEEPWGTYGAYQAEHDRLTAEVAHLRESLQTVIVSITDGDEHVALAVARHALLPKEPA